MRIFAPAALFAFLAAPALLLAEDKATPTQAEIVATYDKKEYQDCLKQLAGVLILNGKAAEGYDKHLLFGIKGECLLQTKQKDSAGYAFADAAKATSDDNKKAVADATAQLIRKSDLAGYKPKTGDNKDVLPIIEPAQRGAALKALFADEYSVAQGKVKEATRGKELITVANTAKNLQPLETLDRAANGSDEKVEALRKSLADHAGKAIGTALDTDAQQVAAIEKSAKEYVEKVVEETDTKTGKKVRRSERVQRGLTDQDRRQLETIIATCNRIPAAVRDLQSVLEKSGSGLSAQSTRADTIKKDAREVLNTRYETEPTRRH